MMLAATTAANAMLAGVAFLMLGCESPQPIEPPVRCPAASCDVGFDTIATISDVSEPGILPDGYLFLERGAAGSIITAGRDGQQVLVFDSTGRLQHVLGQRGSGPGEFRFVRKPMLGPGDSLHVPDLGLGRISVFAPDYSLARVASFPYMPEAVLSDGSYLVTRSLPGVPETGYPINRYRSDGALLVSFGSDSVQTNLNLDLLTRVHVARSRSGAVWSAVPGQHVVELWNPDTGSKERRLELEGDWFQPAEAWNYDERSRPTSVIEGMWEDREDEDGILWVLTRVADSEWQAPVQANVERVVNAAEYGRVYDWIVEAVDLLDGRLLASRRIDDVAWYRGPAGLLAAPLPVDTTVAFDILRPRLEPAGGR